MRRARNSDEDGSLMDTDEDDLLFDDPLADPLGSSKDNTVEEDGRDVQVVSVGHTSDGSSYDSFLG